MKQSNHPFLILKRFAILLLAFSAFSAAHAQAATNPPPNIILIFIDDMGWGDFSCFGNEDAATPNIDRLAKEGIRFEQFYVNSPICSPSRVAISTGQVPQRWNITSYLSHRAHNKARGIAQWLDPSAPMLARFLQAAGYATGHFGKWHMGGQRDVKDAPAITAYGFDESLTNFEGMGPKLLPLTLKPGQDPTKPGRLWHQAEILGDGFKWVQRSEMTGLFADEAIGFIEKAVADEKPFYINLWPDDVHGPYWPPTHKWADDRRGLYLSVLEEMDRQFGKLFERIDKDEALRDNTLILACSDNGPEAHVGSAGGLRGYKTLLYEGGIRSSLVAWGPGILDKADHVDSDSVWSAMDLVPTILSLTETPIPDGITFDGEPLVATLKGQQGSRSAPLFFRRPPDRNTFYGEENLPDLAMRKDQWKFLCEYDGSTPELYDVSNDPGETINLADNHSAVVKEMKDAVLRWHKSMPSDNGATYIHKPRKKKPKQGAK